MDYNDGSWSAGDWAAMAAMMLLFWGLVIGLVLWAVRGVRGPRQSVDVRAGTDRAEAVLADRFARGEIDEEEFRRRRDLIRESTTHITAPHAP